MEKIHTRLREELNFCGLTAAKTASLIGESSSQGLRDVLCGRKRLSAELLAALTANTAVGALYVLTGQRNRNLPEADRKLTPRQAALLDNYQHLSDADKSVIERTALALAQQETLKTGKTA